MQILIQQIWGGAQDSSLTSSRVTGMLLAQDHRLLKNAVFSSQASSILTSKRKYLGTITVSISANDENRTEETMLELSMLPV